MVDGYDANMRRILLAVIALSATLASAQTRIQDVIYLKKGGCAYTLDVFKPKTPNHKAVVWMISGGWFSSHDNLDAGLAGFFTNKGFTVFEVVHGSQPKYTIPEIVPQVRRALRFVRAHAADYDISPDAIGIGGMSAGGHLVLEIAGLATDGDPSAKDPVDRVSDRPNTVVAFFPPTDFENWGAKGVSPISNPAMAVFAPAFGVTKLTSKEDQAKIAHDLSPIILVKAGFPSTLLIHGDADMLVPVQQSQELEALFESLHVVHKLIISKGTGHDGGTVKTGLEPTLAWFDEHLTVPKS